VLGDTAARAAAHEKVGICDPSVVHISTGGCARCGISGGGVGGAALEGDGDLAGLLDITPLLVHGLAPQGLHVFG